MPKETHAPQQVADRAQLINALLTALPYVEDAENDPAFKKGVVKKHVALIRSLVEGGAA